MFSSKLIYFFSHNLRVQNNPKMQQYNILPVGRKIKEEKKTSHKNPIVTLCVHIVVYLGLFKCLMEV